MTSSAQQFVPGRGTILLVADSPPEESRSVGTSPAGRHVAIIALARAVFAAGGRIAMPADAGLSALIATIGLEYVEPTPTNGPGTGRAPVLVIESSGEHGSARRLLAPFVLRGVVDYLDTSAMPLPDGVVTDAAAADLDPRPEPRQAVTAALLDAVPSLATAVLISTGQAGLADLAVLQNRRVTVVTLRDTAHDPDVEERLGPGREPSVRPRFSDDLDLVRERRTGDNPPPRRRREPTTPPYSYIMQRIVADAIERGDC